MFSKPLRNYFVSSDMKEDDDMPPMPPPPLTEAHFILTPDQYFRNPESLDDVKPVQLRRILKHYKSLMNFKSGRIYTPAEFQFLKERFKVLYDFGLLGDRDRLLERIRDVFNKHRSARLIQKQVRGYFARLSLKLRGPALRNRSLCVNSSDGCTMEPVKDIPLYNFFSYKDKDGFIYGFEIDSLIQLILSTQTAIGPMRCINPFNRARMESMLPQIKILIRLTCMMHNLMYPKFVMLAKPVYVRRSRLPMGRTPPSSTSVHHQPTIPIEYNMENMIQRMREIRSRSFEERASALFMEIDQLGHYTQSTWFTALEGAQMKRYLRYLQDFWMYRAHLSQEVKLRICPLWDPFISLLRGSVNIFELSDEHVKTVCIGVMEDMIFTGVNAESRILGSFQVLTCLTLVSHQARQSMMYLYESVSY